jgi:hypothetical protein
MEKTIFVGDTHCDLDIKKVVDYCIAHSKSELQETTVIQLGDFGGIWYPKKCKKEEDILNLWDNFGFKRVLFIPGNHENYNRLLGDEFHQIHIDEISGDVKQISKNVYMLLSGHFYTINKKTFFTIRGARSIDKDFRIKDISWWSNEVISGSEYDEIKSAIHGNSVDYLITHTGSKIFKDKLFGRNSVNDVTEDMIYNILGCCEYKAHICGHYHLDVKYPRYKEISLYNVILTEEEIFAELKGQNNKLEYVDD